MVTPISSPKLARPHAGAVDDVFRRDIAACRAHAGDAAALLQDGRDGHAFDDAGARHAGALGERHRHVHRVHPAVVPDVEAGQDVVDARQREQALHLGRRDLLHVHAAKAVEGGDAPELLQPVGVGGDLDEADGHEPGGLAGLGLEPGVEVARVLPELGGGLGGGAEGDHQAGGVPGGAGGQPVALQEHDILPAHVGEVVGHRGADDAAADHHDARPIGQDWRPTLALLLRLASAST